MYVCMMYVCMYVCIYDVHMYVCMMYVCIYVCMYVRTCYINDSVHYLDKVIQPLKCQILISAFYWMYKKVYVAVPNRN